MVGWVKVNWDIAVEKKSGRIGVGVVVRDDQGEVVAARCLTRMGTLEATAGEAIASYYAVCLCREIGAHNIMLERDAK